MACNPSELLEAAKCFQCKYDSLGTLYSAVEIRLLCAIRDGEQLECDPDTLAQEARCILACVPPGAMEAVKLRILCDIVDAASNGGNGGTQLVEALPDNDTFFEQISFEGTLDSSNLVGVTSLTMNMTSMLGYIDLENCDSLVTLSLPNLVSLGDGVRFLPYLSVVACNVFTTLSVPVLSSVQPGGTFFDAIVLELNPLLASVSFPSLVSNGGAVSIITNPLLTSISFPLLIPTPATNLEFQDNALTAVSVNHLLARAVASPTWGTSGEIFDSTGGTNAAPTGQGVADKATLLGRGASIITN